MKILFMLEDSMQKTLARARHQEEGEWILEVAGNYVKFSCHWPFESQTDEWIDVSNTFSLPDFKTAVEQLLDTGEVRVRGLHSGFISFKILPEEGKLQMVVLGADQVSQSEIVIPLSLYPEDLVTSLEA